MNFVRCSKGHFYDSDRHVSCPKCNVSGVVPTNDVNYGGSTIKQNPATDGDEYKTVKLDFNQAPANDDEYKTVKLDFGGQPTAPAADDEYKTVQFGFDTTPASSPKEEDDDNYKTVSLSSSIKNLQDTYDEYTPEKDAEVLRAAGKEDVYAPVNVETTSAEPANDELTEINPEEDKTEEKAEKIYAALETAEAEVWSEVSEEVKENLEKGKELTKLVGWLVDRISEESYELRMDMTINPVNEVVIYVKAEQENVLSADTKAADAQLVLSYDEAQKDYMIKNNSASVSLNGRTLDSESRLASYDRISINGKELVFVPFYR